LREASITDIQKVSYFKLDRLDDRAIALQSCYLGNSEWESWIPTDKGLLPLKMVDIVDACYYSKSPAKETDVYISFISLIMKRAYFKELVHFEQGILEDINNLSASVSKINLFHQTWRENKELVTRRFVTTELESNLSVKKLQPTFSKMVYKANKLSSAQEIESRYLIPPALAQFYARNGVFFDWLRSYRDKISHGGNNIESLYIMDDGFAVSTKIEPFIGLHIWEKTELKTNKLGSVRALIAYTILNTLHVLEDFTSVIQTIMQLPPDIAPDYDVYIRGENLGVLHELHKYVDGDEWIKYNKSQEPIKNPRAAF
jgi:hypothetical protein